MSHFSALQILPMLETSIYVGAVFAIGEIKNCVVLFLCWMDVNCELCVFEYKTIALNGCAKFWCQKFHINRKGTHYLSWLLWKAVEWNYMHTDEQTEKEKKNGPAD